MMLGEIEAGRLWLWGYIAVGVPIAYWHMKREQDTTPANPEDEPAHKVLNFAKLALAMLWPFLLLAIFAQMIGNRLDGPPKRPK